MLHLVDDLEDSLKFLLVLLLAEMQVSVDVLLGLLLPGFYCTMSILPTLHLS